MGYEVRYFRLARRNREVRVQPKLNPRPSEPFATSIHNTPHDSDDTNRYLIIAQCVPDQLSGRLQLIDTNDGASRGA